MATAAWVLVAAAVAVVATGTAVPSHVDCATLPAAVQLQRMVAPLVEVRAHVVPLELAPDVRHAHAACAADARRVSWMVCLAAAVMWKWSLPGFFVCGLLGSSAVSVMDSAAPAATQSVGLWRIGWAPLPGDSMTCGGRRASRFVETLRTAGPLHGTLSYFPPVLVTLRGPPGPAFNGTVQAAPGFLWGSFVYWDALHPGAVATGVEVDADGVVRRGTFHGVTCGAGPTQAL
jgi:hypothetical protein